MDLVKTVQSCLSRWKSGGEEEWYVLLSRGRIVELMSSSRRLVIAPHCNPLDASCVDVLVTVYETLFLAAFASRTPKHPLTIDDFVAFVQSVLDHLPSSSSSSSTRSSNISAFGEHLVDIVWSLDAGLDEVLVEAKTVVTACEQNGGDMNATLVKAAKVKQQAEADKSTICSIVKKLLVGRHSLYRIAL
jgi:THO complex subunit 2